LNQLDGLVEGDGRVVVLTTNHKELLDPALYRPGRCDLVVHLGLCSKEMIADLYELYYENPMSDAELDSLPANVLTPAVVANAFLSGSAEQAVRVLHARTKE
jgi:chaperone BCS1